MNREEFTSELRKFVDNQNECGFEAFLVGKTSPKLRNLAFRRSEYRDFRKAFTDGIGQDPTDDLRRDPTDDLRRDSTDDYKQNPTDDFKQNPDVGIDQNLTDESRPKQQDNLEQNLMEVMISVIRERFLDEEAVYAGETDIADNQKKFHIIQQTDEYRPFDVENWEQKWLCDREYFLETDLDDFKGIIFKFPYSDRNLWCYQNKRSVTVANRRKTGVLARLLHYENGMYLEEQKERVLTFLRAVDIIVMDGYIVTDDIGLLERSFDFQIFIRQKADEASRLVRKSGLFSGMDKLDAYLSSEAKSHVPYRKKLIRAMDSPVLEMTLDELYGKISSLPRWSGKFKAPVNGSIPIEKVSEIESMIDLLSERFTVSEVTGQEYDTEVKKKADKIV